MSSDLVLRASDGNAFKLIEVKKYSNDLEVDRVTALESDVGQSTEYVFRVSQRISKLGEQSGTIAFCVQTRDSPESQKVVVPVRYLGVRNPRTD